MAIMIKYLLNNRKRVILKKLQAKIEFLKIKLAAPPHFIEWPEFLTIILSCKSFKWLPKLILRFLIEVTLNGNSQNDF